MDDDGNRQCILNFLNAFYSGDASTAQACCDSELDSITYAPVELFPHLGHKHGRAWVTEAIAIQQQRYSTRKYEVLFISTDGDRVATMTRCALTKRNDERVVQVVVAEFFTLQNGHVIQHRAFFDSFDLVQQLLGHDLSEEFSASVRTAMAR